MNVKDNLGLERDELNILNLHLNCFYLKQNLEAPVESNPPKNLPHNGINVRILLGFIIKISPLEISHPKMFFEDTELCINTRKSLRGV